MCDNIGSSEMNCELKVVNMSEEAFNDALFFSKKIAETENLFEQYRYKRASLVFFCVSAEARLNSLILENLKKIVLITSLKEKDKEELETWLGMLTNEKENEVPKGYSTIVLRLNRFLLKSINMRAVRKNDEQIPEFEKYVKLSNVRNAVAHYSYRNFKQAYKEIDMWINDAPDIIQNLFSKYYELVEDNELYYTKDVTGNKQSLDEFLKWFIKREPWVIE